MRVIVFGAGGFIGNHLVSRLVHGGHEVFAVDKKILSNWHRVIDGSVLSPNTDLSDPTQMRQVILSYEADEIYQLAANMGGAGYLFTGQNDADVMTESTAININAIRSVKEINPNIRVFYSSSACVYPMRNQNSKRES